MGKRKFPHLHYSTKDVALMRIIHHSGFAAMNEFFTVLSNCDSAIIHGQGKEYKISQLLLLYNYFSILIILIPFIMISTEENRLKKWEIIFSEIVFQGSITFTKHNISVPNDMINPPKCHVRPAQSDLPFKHTAKTLIRP